MNIVALFKVLQTSIAYLDIVAYLKGHTSNLEMP